MLDTLWATTLHISR